MPNAIASLALGAVHTWKTLSLAFMTPFTLLKTSSKGKILQKFGLISGKGTKLCCGVTA